MFCVKVTKFIPQKGQTYHAGVLIVKGCATSSHKAPMVVRVFEQDAFILVFFLATMGRGLW